MSITPTGPLTDGYVGTPYSQPFAVTGGKAPYAWAIASGVLPVGLTFSSGNISGTPTTAGSSTFTVQVTDANGSSTSKSFTITVFPALFIPEPVCSSPIVGIQYSCQLSATGGKPALSWSLSSGALPTGLGLSATGLINGTPTTGGIFSFSPRVTDNNGNTLNKNMSLTVYAPLAITTSSPLQWGTTNIPFSATLTGTGGKTPFAWTITGGSLPGGLTLNNTTGVISGAPTTVGSFTFTVTLNDAVGTPAVSKSFTIDIFATFVIPVQTLPNGTVGTLYSATLTSTGGKTPYSSWVVASGNLPAGLSLSGTGVISGTPTGTDSTFTVRANDANNSTAVSPSLTITINAAPLVITSTSQLLDAYKSTTYSTTLTASGGKTAYSWSVTSGNLPSGLTLNATTGVISGTPTKTVSSSFTIKVTDSVGTSTSKSFTLTVYVVPAISTNSLAAGTVGSSYSQTLGATSGKAPYIWSISTGNLPSGLILDQDSGIIGGTPTASGSFTFTVLVADVNVITASKSFTITINPAKPDLVLTSVSGPATGKKGTTITVTATVKNQGLGSAGSSTLTFYLSTDPTITTADTKLGDATISTLAAGVSQTITATFTIPNSQTSRTYYIGAYADRTTTVTESVETNNTLAGNTIVVN